MLEKWHCTVCNKEFKTGEWACADGVTNHIVEVKEYLLDDAPTDGSSSESLRDGRTLICNIPPERKAMHGDEVRIIPGGCVEFVRGRYSTSDPEIQHYLNRKGGFCTEDRWNAVWLSQNQQMQIERDRLTALSQRLENEKNELLALQKKEKAKQPVGVRG